MTPRPRRKGNKDLPQNLYAKKIKGKVYYQYKHPKTGKFTGFGTNKIEAINAANQLNQLLIKQNKGLVSRVTNAANPFSDFLTYYRDEIMPGKRVKGFALSQKTISEHTRLITHFINELGHIEITAITQRDIADYLNMQSTAETYNKHRALLCNIFKYAVSDGLVNENIPSRIVKRDSEQTKRQRLTVEQYAAIYASARPAIQNAMELSLNTIQRRSDIQKMRFDDEKDGYLYIIQSKTRKHGKSAYLRIPVDLPVIHSETGARTLKDLINNCRDIVACPFVIHERRKRRVRSVEKEHFLQLSPKQISDGFAEARDKTGLFSNIENPPTFHELISLGQHLREQNGWQIAQIQLMRGHTSDKMTRHYLSGHEWTTIDVK